MEYQRVTIGKFVQTMSRLGIIEPQAKYSKYDNIRFRFALFKVLERQ